MYSNFFDYINRYKLLSLKNAQMDIMEHVVIYCVPLAFLGLNVLVVVNQSALSKIVIVLMGVQLMMETLLQK